MEITEFVVGTRWTESDKPCDGFVAFSDGMICGFSSGKKSLRVYEHSHGEGRVYGERLHAVKSRLKQKEFPGFSDCSICGKTVEPRSYHRLPGQSPDSDFQCWDCQPKLLCKIFGHIPPDNFLEGCCRCDEKLLKNDVFQELPTDYRTKMHSLLYWSKGKIEKV